MRRIDAILDIAITSDLLQIRQAGAIRAALMLVEERLRDDEGFKQEYLDRFGTFTHQGQLSLMED